MTDRPLPLDDTGREGRTRGFRKWSSRNSLIFVVLASLALWGTLVVAMLGIAPGLAG